MEKYKLSAHAKADLRRIYRYGVENFGIVKADKYFHSLHEAFAKIAENPFLYQLAAGDYHRCVVEPNSIYYRISGDIVEIIRILGGQDMDKNLP